jgi:beta-galactosidase/beta-glucuronidase
MQFSWLELGFFGISCSIFGALLIRNKRRKALHHENPKVQGVNRIKSRTILCGFASESEARHFVLQNRCSPFVKSLNGVWKFTLFDCFQDAVKEMRSDSNKSMEGTIKVPSHWQLKANGDLPSYNNFKNSIPVTPPLVPDSNPTGYYKYQFELSKEWFRRFITITFSGVDSAYYVWINHQYVGFSKDSKLSTEFDISDFVKFDNKNLIEVLVVKYSDGFFLEDQEKWNLSGIFKDVWLTSFPSEVHISDFK